MLYYIGVDFIICLAKARQGMWRLGRSIGIGMGICKGIGIGMGMGMGMCIGMNMCMGRGMGIDICIIIVCFANAQQGMAKLSRCIGMAFALAFA